MEKTLNPKIIKIALIGPESTGKTTLAKRLASKFNTLYVPEYLRTFAQKQWDNNQAICQWEDLVPILQGQLQQESQYLAKLTTNIIFFDTNAISLLVYANLYFNTAPDEMIQAVLEQDMNYYFLTDIDVPWEYDVLRDRPGDRAKIFKLFKTQLITRQLPFTVLSGSLRTRIKNASVIIQNLFLQ